MMKKQKKQEFSTIGILDCQECKTQEEWAEMNRRHRRSMGFLEW